MNQTLNDKIAQQKKVLADLKKEQVKAQKEHAKKVAEYAKYRHYIKSGEYLFRQVWDFESYCEQCGWKDAASAEHFGSLSLAQDAEKGGQLELIYDMMKLTDKQRVLYNSWVKYYKEEAANE